MILLAVFAHSAHGFASGGARGADVFDCFLNGNELQSPDSQRDSQTPFLQASLEEGPTGWTNTEPIVISASKNSKNPLTQLNVCLSLSDAQLDAELPPRFGVNVMDAVLVCGNLAEKPYRFLQPGKAGHLGVFRRTAAGLLFTLFEYHRENGQHGFTYKSHVSGLCSPVK
jgi:hypothetical protein